MVNQILQENEMAGITLTAHPPEHGSKRANVPAQAGHCCTCCCCCCLHSLGAIVGSLVGPKMGGRPKNAWEHLSLVEDWDDEKYTPGSFAATNSAGITEQAPPLAANSPKSSRADDGAPGIALSSSHRSATSLFWWSVLAFAALGLVGIGLAVGGSGGHLFGALLGFGFGVLMTFPLLQLLAAAATAVILAISTRPDKHYQYRQLAKITLGMLCGTSIGLLVMLCPLTAFGGERIVYFIPWLLLIAAIGFGSKVGLTVLARR